MTLQIVAKSVCHCKKDFWNKVVHENMLSEKGAEKPM